MNKIIKELEELQEDVIWASESCWDFECDYCVHSFHCNLYKALCALEEAAFFLEEELRDRR